jgi:hypothetical protein
LSLVAASGVPAVRRARAAPPRRVPRLGPVELRQANFHDLSRRIFGHEGTSHDLVTPREVASERHGIRVGDRVRFEHEGRRRVGLVHRVIRRATVLVEDPRGRPYSDGGRYATF